MPMPRRKIPTSPPEVIRARERLKPFDPTQGVRFKNPADDERYYVHFVWNNPRRISEAKMHGYTFVTTDEAEYTGFVGDETTKNICYGDMVAMKIPAEIKRGWERDRQAADRAALTRQFEQTAEVAAHAGFRVRQEVTEGKTMVSSMPADLEEQKSDLFVPEPDDLEAEIAEETTIAEGGEPARRKK